MFVYRVIICIYLRDQNLPATDNCVMSIAPTHIHFAVSEPKATGRDYSKKVANTKVSRSYFNDCTWLEFLKHEWVQSTLIERQRTIE